MAVCFLFYFDSSFVFCLAEMTIIHSGEQMHACLSQQYTLLCLMCTGLLSEIRIYPHPSSSGCPAWKGSRGKDVVLLEAVLPPPPGLVQGRRRGAGGLREGGGEPQAEPHVRALAAVVRPGRCRPVALHDGGRRDRGGVAAQGEARRALEAREGGREGAGGSDIRRADRRLRRASGRVIICT